MAKPLHVFVNNLSDWNVVYNQGQDSLGFHHHVRLSTAVAASSQLYAVIDGLLSTKPPISWPADPTQFFDLAEFGPPVPGTVTLYLYPLLASAALRQSLLSVNNIVAFAYRNVDIGSLEVELGDQLDKAGVPRESGGRSGKVDRMVRGLMGLPITSGHSLGRAAATPANPNGPYTADFGVFTGQGLRDPSDVFDSLRGFFEPDQQPVDEYLALAPKRWPVIDPTLTPQQVVQMTTTTIYSMGVLSELHDRPGFLALPNDWRTIGNNQKALYDRRLRKRAGYPVDPTDVPFEFDDLDANNVFQIEAIVELFANFADPWLAGTAPTNRLDKHGQPNPNYITVDLLAEVNPVLVVIDSFGPRFVGGECSVSGNVLALTPHITSIPINLAKELQASITTLNINFDTIYLPSDTARDSRTYRITGKNPALSEVTLDGNPVLLGGSSSWQIPAGLSGTLPALRTDFQDGGRGYDHYEGILFVVEGGQIKGNSYLCSSYTSRRNTGPSEAEWLSSVRGNRKYDIRSLTSRADAAHGGAFRNYCFEVRESGSTADSVGVGLAIAEQPRFYFETPARADLTGKTVVRIHQGCDTTDCPDKTHKGNGSAGCIVSPYFPTMRAALVSQYLQAHPRLQPLMAAHGPIGQALKESVALWNGRGDTKNPARVSAADWDGVITGSLWIIRPHEVPLAP